MVTRWWQPWLPPPDGGSQFFFSHFFFKEFRFLLEIRRRYAEKNLCFLFLCLFFIVQFFSSTLTYICICFYLYLHFAVHLADKTRYSPILNQFLLKKKYLLVGFRKGQNQIINNRQGIDCIFDMVKRFTCMSWTVEAVDSVMDSWSCRGDTATFA